jgi:imidazolonepropionase
MSTILIRNIGMLVGTYDAAPKLLKGAAMNHVPMLADAWLAIDGERIQGFGTMADCPSSDRFSQVIEANHEWVFPCFCDSHTHLVYAGSRDGEFRDKIAGLSYEKIARRGGGILNSADLLNETSEDELFQAAAKRLRNCAKAGTGAIEIKSGYGLTVDGELKMLRVSRRLQKSFPMLEIRSTFLGAHAVGRAYTGRQAEYVDMLINELLPKVAEDQLADFVDVFCDEGFFTTEETSRILVVAKQYGIRGKIHANELAVSGGVQVGVKHNALSVDHLERITDAEIAVLKDSKTIPTMLPGASFFLGIPYGKARQAVDASLPLALASDYNPGSSPSGSMRFIASLGCFKMKLTPEESFNAVTVNGAAALGLSDMGAIFPGAKASLFFTEPLPSLVYLQYAYTEPLITRVLFKGQSLI